MHFHGVAQILCVGRFCLDRCSPRA